jgi:glycine cleavage system T protein (aminomethyltransferase)
MSELKRTALYNRHNELGAQIVEFGGWEMPIKYKPGIINEHLATRRNAGIFDVSHMGRFIISGKDAVPFLQKVLTNNVAALDVGDAQYTIIPNDNGGAVDDAYLYYFEEGSYLLVVNASNRVKDWKHFQEYKGAFKDLEMEDLTEGMSMVSLQGPLSKEILQRLLEKGHLPEPLRNKLSIATIAGTEVRIARTGYTGEPICFELFVSSDKAESLWRSLEKEGAEPIGLGARDTLRLETGLPLYGHELGLDKDAKEIPIFAIALGRLAVSFSPFKGDFIGRKALERQFVSFQKIIKRDYSDTEGLPQRVKMLALEGRGLARDGSAVFYHGTQVGYMTSGTMVPYWLSEGVSITTEYSTDFAKRSIGLCLINSNIRKYDEVEVDIRGKRVKALIVPYHLQSEAAPYTQAITYEDLINEKKEMPASGEYLEKARTLLNKAVNNTKWRQEECINLIPSEQTASSAARMLSIMDPVNRYAEHKKVKAFKDAEVFYYQGTGFISEVEVLLEQELRKYLGCEEVETRLVSGQMANTAVFSAMLDFINRSDRKAEPRRMRSIMNNHIIRGGHLSAQPMGALRDFVARDPRTEQPAVVNFPVYPDNPYKLDVDAARILLEEYKPELIILGKSMILHKEPVTEFRRMIDEMELDTVLMYDMAHVLGLIGPNFQEPFKEGANIVTGSTHKTFYGTQRGIVGVNYSEEDINYPLWGAIERRSFPGSVSNHHLGTLVGLLMASYEMNAFKDEYQKKVIGNAKFFAASLKTCGLDVAGDSAISFTETHQVVVNVGYSKGPEIAQRLEENNIVVNYQATPEDEGFSASGALRLGVSEMTRFGMEEKDFSEIAQLMKDVVIDNMDVRDKVAALRSRFQDMRYCFRESDYDKLVQDLHKHL